MILRDKLISDIKNLFELENEDYYKPIEVSNFYSSNYIEYDSNGDRDKNLLIKENLNKTKPFSKHIIIDLQKSDTWKIQLIVEIDFFKYTNEEQTMWWWYLEQWLVVDSKAKPLCSLI